MQGHVDHPESCHAGISREVKLVRSVQRRDPAFTHEARRGAAPLAQAAEKPPRSQGTGSVCLEFPVCLPA